jgi:hypothetical protein
VNSQPGPPGTGKRPNRERPSAAQMNRASSFFFGSAQSGHRLDSDAEKERFNEIFAYSYLPLTQGIPANDCVLRAGNSYVYARL